MSELDLVDEGAGKVLPFGGRGDVAPAGEGHAESFDHVIGDDEPGQVVPLDEPPPPVERRPIIPPNLRTWTGARRTVARHAGLAWHRTAYHAVRLWWYVLLAVWFAPRGLARVSWAAVRWAWNPELQRLIESAADDRDRKEGRQLARDAGGSRRARFGWLGAGGAVLAAAGLWVYAAAPTAVQVAAYGALVVLLARRGQAADRPIVGVAVVPPRFRRINYDVVLRAYYRAGLGHPEKDGMAITFGSRMSRDNLDAGSQVLVDLPFGTSHSEALGKREKIASGLDVALSQVYLKPDPSSNRRHLLWVADVDPLSVPAGRTPLLDLKVRDIWKAAPLGLNERGVRVMLPLIWTSILVGAQPRKGKTFTARLLALFAALDPYVRLSVFDGKASPDWRAFAKVAWSYGFGVLPDRTQGDPVENLLTTLRAVKREVQDRNQRLSELAMRDPARCPEGKLTRELARDRAFGMPVWVLVLDEFQEYLTTGDPAVDQEIAELFVYAVKVAPSAGIIVLSSTQKPSGIGGSGKVQKLFTDFRDQHQTRIGLKVGSYSVSNLILGDGAYGEGYDASALPADRKGVGILYDSPVDHAVVRFFLADQGDAARILDAARAHRERAGTLDGMAAGDRVNRQPRDVLADVLDVYGPADTFLAWETIAARLADQLPEVYAGATGDAVSATVRGLGLGIDSKSGADKSLPVGSRLRGAYLAQLRRAAESRQVAA